MSQFRTLKREKAAIAHDNKLVLRAARFRNGLIQTYRNHLSYAAADGGREKTSSDLSRGSHR